MRGGFLIATLTVFLAGALGPLCQVACAEPEASAPVAHAPCHEAPPGVDPETRSAAPPAGCSACLQAASLQGQERLTSAASLQLLAFTVASTPAPATRHRARAELAQARARSSPQPLFLKYASLLL
jgi:hypothetical protein